MLPAKNAAVCWLISCCALCRPRKRRVVKKSQKDRFHRSRPKQSPSFFSHSRACSPEACRPPSAAPIHRRPLPMRAILTNHTVSRPCKGSGEGMGHARLGLDTVWLTCDPAREGVLREQSSGRERQTPDSSSCLVPIPSLCISFSPIFVHNII